MRAPHPEGPKLLEHASIRILKGIVIGNVVIAGRTGRRPIAPGERLAPDRMTLCRILIYVDTKHPRKQAAIKLLRGVIWVAHPAFIPIGEIKKTVVSEEN